MTAASPWASHVSDASDEFGSRVVLVTEQIGLHYDEEGARRMKAIIPAGRLGDPRDVAEACLFLASRRASYISGASLAVHGGGERPAFLDATGTGD